MLSSGYLRLTMMIKVSNQSKAAYETNQNRGWLLATLGFMQWICNQQKLEIFHGGSCYCHQETSQPIATRWSDPPLARMELRMGMVGFHAHVQYPPKTISPSLRGRASGCLLLCKKAHGTLLLFERFRWLVNGYSGNIHLAVILIWCAIFLWHTKHTQLSKRQFAPINHFCRNKLSSMGFVAAFLASQT